MMKKQHLPDARTLTRADTLRSVAADKAKVVEIKQTGCLGWCWPELRRDSPRCVLKTVRILQFPFPTPGYESIVSYRNAVAL